MEGEVRVGYQMAARLRNATLSLPAEGSATGAIRGRLVDVNDFYLAQEPKSVRVRDGEGHAWLEWREVEMQQPGVFLVKGAPKMVEA